jgi:hypothetical protein
MESLMPDAVFVPLALTLMAYCGFYWSTVTANIIEEARQERMKRHLDWTVTHRGRAADRWWRIW